MNTLYLQFPPSIGLDESAKVSETPEMEAKDEFENLRATF